MRKEADKKIFIIVLLAILIAAMCFSLAPDDAAPDSAASAQGSGEHSSANSIRLINRSLSLEIIDEDSYAVNGEGVLEYADLYALLEYSDILPSDVVNLIIGDAVTEIEYNCINNFTYLETLKIGNGVTRVRNGGIKNCINLRYLYIPAALKKVGKDFLYGCTSLMTVITGASADDVNKLYDFSGYTILPDCSSESDFATAVENLDRQKIYQTIETESMLTTDPDAGTSPIVLHPGFMQYGPFSGLHQGDYLVRVSGANFDKLAEDDIIFRCPVSDQREIKHITPNEIEYTVSIEEAYTDGVEYAIKNSTDSELIEISMIEVYTIDTEPLPDLGFWWDTQNSAAL